MLTSWCARRKRRGATVWHAGIDESRLRVVLLGVDAQPASLDEIAVAKQRFDLQRPYIVWVGTVEPRKNVAGLLGAFASVGRDHRDHELVLIGPKGWGPQVDELLAPRRRRQSSRPRPRIPVG